LRSDIARWDKKYLDRHPDFEADSLLSEYRYLMDGNGPALDIACGTGQNALDLASIGYQVVAVDGSEVGLRYGYTEAQRLKLSIQWLVTDLDQIQLPTNHFRLVIAFRYLNRALFPQLIECLVPGGLLIYKTFNLNHLAKRKDFNKSFLVQNGELSKFLKDLELIATNDTENNKESTAYFVGRRQVTRGKGN